MQRFCEANSAHYSRNLILSGTLSPILFSRLFEGLPFSRGNAHMMNRIIKRVLSKLEKKQLLSSLIQSGRKNDSIVDFQKAIDLGSKTARAELALLCFNQNLQYAECKKAFELVKDGSRYGCSDCKGMFAHFYRTGFRGVVSPCDETAYLYACDSANAGSWFGKMALAHFLKSLLGVIDPDEETFYVLWTDPFIQNFASPRLNVSIEEDPFKDWSENDCIILMEFDKRRIVKHLIEKIKQEHVHNPDMPKVWDNLPAL